VNFAWRDDDDLSWPNHFSCSSIRKLANTSVKDSEFVLFMHLPRKGALAQLRSPEFDPRYASWLKNPADVQSSI
jgi:hypothetical protein